MPRKNKYIPKSNDKINKYNYNDLLKLETDGKYEFLENYIKSTTPIECKHLDCGNIWRVAPYEIIKRGSRCPLCANKIRAEKEKSNIDELNNLLFESYGYYPYNFIGEYINHSTPIRVKCNICNNESNITPGNIKNNIRLKRKPLCKQCNINRMKDNKASNEEYEIKLLKLFNKKEYEILEDYKGVKESIKHKCIDCDLEFNVKPQNIIYAKTKHNRKYCPRCNNMERDIRSYEERLKDSNPNIIALEEFKGRRTPIMHKCLKCKNQWLSAPNNRLNGEGCPKCSNIFTQSKGEKEIIDFITENYKGEIILRNRSILNGKELDIYLPELKIAIEYDGLYWHNEKHKGKNYHIDKTRKCKEHGVRLIHVFEDEWVNKNELVKFKLLHILGINNQEKIYARKCYIEEIDSSLKNEFLERNHIQGKDNASIKLGLWLPKEDGDELIAIMTFVKRRLALGSKHKGEFDYELSRFATDRDYRAIGAFGKLFKYFIENYEHDSIITYADIRWSEGNVYIKNNFEYTHDSRPNYWYVDRNDGTKRIHRFNFRKQELKNKFPEIYDSGLTEFEIMDNTNFYRIWDCGNMVFKYEKKNKG
ncbi:putative Hef-like homing endonuclease [Bacillus phage vB_BspM_Internexus]|nr:putative Hef-like homing endonuclease [Bacillus phage vB_BspM_Internexus]